MDNHEHRYFIFQVKADFESFNVPKDALLHPENVEFATQLDALNLYRRQEYAVLGCACGDVIKQKVKHEN